MESKKKSLIIACALLLLLSGALVALLLLKQDAQAPVASAAEKVLLESGQAVQSVAIETQSERYEITPLEDGSEEQTWQIADLAGIEQSQVKYSDLISICNKLTYTEKLENPKELSVYGLVSPASKATITYADGSSELLLVGDETTDQEGRYCKLADEDGIYIISSVSGGKFTRGILSYVDLTLVPKIDSDSDPGVESVSIECYKESPVSYRIERREEEDASSLWLVSPIERQLSESDQKTLLALVSSFAADEAAAVYPTSEQLLGYGFGDPTAQVDYRINGVDYTLLIGAGIEYTQEEDTLGLGGIGSYYIQLKGRDAVYRVSVESLGWLNLRY